MRLVGLARLLHQLAAHGFALHFGGVVFGAAGYQLDNLPACAHALRRSDLVGLHLVNQFFHVFRQHIIAHFVQPAVHGFGFLRVAFGNGGKIAALLDGLGDLLHPFFYRAHVGLVARLQDDAADGVHGIGRALRQGCAAFQGFVDLGIADVHVVVQIA